MSNHTHNDFLTFSLDIHHVYKLNNEEWRYAYHTNGVVTFSSIANPAKTVNYEFGTLNRLSAAGHVEVVPFGLMPEHLRPAPACSFDDVMLNGLSPSKRTVLEGRHALVQGYLTLKNAQAFKVKDAEIKAAMDDIRKEAAAYLVENLPDPQLDLDWKAYEEGTGSKPRTKLNVTIPDAVSARTLRKWAKAYERFGKRGLLDSRHKQGNRNSYFTAEEMALMAKVINKEYLNLQRKTMAAVVMDVKIAFEDENKRREENDEAPLRVPGRAAVREFIKRLDKFRVLVARHGQKEAMNRMRPGKDGIQVSRPLERVEIDEWKIDLITILAKSGLLNMFEPEELERLGLLKENMRWWLVVAIDCRTRCILGMVLTPNPRASAAIKCLRMVVSDKGQFADLIGALAPWSMFGTPETIFVDNGSAFKSIAFTSTCIDLGTDRVQTIAGSPSMRSQIEGVFHTMGVSFMPRMSGRSFGSVAARGDHPAEDRACHSVDDLAYTLVRWVVDVYHNTPHSGLGGRTPLQQWEADLEEGNYPLKAAPTLRRKRIAFGLPLVRTVQKSGIRVLNINYTSGDLAAWFLKNGNKPVNVRWLDENIGSIEVELDDLWVEVPAASDAFKDVDATTWTAARRALRAKDRKRTEWEEAVVMQTIRDIEALNANRKASYSIVDHGWDETRFKAVEKEAMTNFDIVETRETTTAASVGHGGAIAPVQSQRQSTVADAVEAAKSETPSKGNWTFKS